MCEVRQRLTENCASECLSGRKDAAEDALDEAEADFWAWKKLVIISFRKYKWQMSPKKPAPCLRKLEVASRLTKLVFRPAIQSMLHLRLDTCIFRANSEGFQLLEFFQNFAIYRPCARFPFAEHSLKRFFLPEQQECALSEYQLLYH